MELGEPVLAATRGLSAVALVPSCEARPGPFLGFDVLDSFEAAAEPWSRLLSIAATSPYQRLDWLAAWMETEGRANGVTPFLVMARDARGRTVGLLPLGVQRRGLLTVASYLGGRETNYNMGLFDPAAGWTAADVEQLLRRAGQRRVDLFELLHQPEQWDGAANPMAALGRSQSSPSFSHRAQLMPDGEAFMKAHLSAANRKKLRAKANHLAALGPVDHRVASTDAEKRAVIDAHLEQKAAKLALIGVAVPDAGSMRRLFYRACASDGQQSGPVELHALHCGERIVATFGGIAHHGRFSGLLISYDLDPAIARCSPGELLLSSVIRQKCAAGFTGFDLGVGEARYKDSYCPIEDRLVDSFLPLSMAGQVAMAGEAATLRLKTAIKQSPRAWGAVQAARRQVARVRRFASA